jgi:acetyl-CoA synthetase
VQQAANRLSNVLGAMGVMAGDRVAIILPQRPETGIAHMACYQMGAIAVPISHLFGADALEFRLTHAGCASPSSTKAGWKSSAPCATSCRTSST